MVRYKLAEPLPGEMLQVRLDTDAWRPFLVLWADTPTRVTGLVFFSPATDRYLSYLQKNLNDFPENVFQAVLALEEGPEVGQWRRVPLVLELEPPSKSPSPPEGDPP